MRLVRKDNLRKLVLKLMFQLNFLTNKTLFFKLCAFEKVFYEFLYYYLLKSFNLFLLRKITD